MPKYDDEDDDYDDRPRRRKRRNDDDDDFDDDDRRPIRKPKRKKQGLSNTWIGVLIGAGVLMVLAVVGCCLAIPYSMSKVKDAAKRSHRVNDLKQIGLGAVNYHDATLKLPVGAFRENDGNAAAISEQSLSWRVAILPYVDQSAVYQRLKRNEQWNSAANTPITSLSVTPFCDPKSASNVTTFRMFVGPRTLFDPSKGYNQQVSLRTISDGTSSTIYCVEAADGVPWAQFRELNYRTTGNLPPLGEPDAQVFLMLLCDGSVRIVKKSVNPDVLRKAITPSGGEQFLIDDLDN